MKAPQRVRHNNWSDDCDFYGRTPPIPPPPPDKWYDPALDWVIDHVHFRVSGMEKKR